MPRLPWPSCSLDDDQRDLFACHLDSVGVPQLVRGKASPHACACRGTSQLRASSGRSPRPSARTGAPQHDDQRAHPQSLRALAGAAHHSDDLLDRRRISRVVASFCAAAGRVRGLATSPATGAGLQRLATPTAWLLPSLEESTIIVAPYGPQAKRSGCGGQPSRNRTGNGRPSGSGIDRWRSVGDMRDVGDVTSGE